MRAIDADALLDEVMERHCKECDKRKGIKNGKYRIIYEIGDAPCRACDVDDVKDELEDAPTIEPQPQRTGRWLPDNNSVYEMRFICSECKESQVVPTIGFTKYKPIWDFCPICGAEMEGQYDSI